MIATDARRRVPTLTRVLRWLNGGSQHVGAVGRGDTAFVGPCDWPAGQPYGTGWAIMQARTERIAQRDGVWHDTVVLERRSQGN
jgi:hypothetical protein